MKTFNLGWGESVAVRKAFLETRKHPIVFDTESLLNLGYPDYSGDPALVELTRQIIKRNIKLDYKYILITNGATGGATIAMRRFALCGKKVCITNDPPYFRMYPSMIEASGLIQLWSSTAEYCTNLSRDIIYLVDSLSNPLGYFSNMKRDKWNNPIIWDSVYYGNVYAPGIHPMPDHDVLVGSYSKLTGLNGLRVGWIATNDLQLYNDMKRLVTAEYCGISAASTKIIMDTAGQFTDEDWALFEASANNKLNYNREEFSKLEKYFGFSPVSPYGMFYYAEMDEKCKKLFDGSGIIWSPGSQLGTSDDFGRFNIGQDCKLIKEAVKTILKNDRI